MIKSIPFALGAIFGYTIEVGAPKLNEAMTQRLKRLRSERTAHGWKEHIV